jgi:Protein of unknown function (DUF1569)
MPSLFHNADNQHLIARLSQITPDTPAQWGKMNAAQMVAHCCVPLQVAFDEVRLKRGLIGVLFGWLAKRKLAKPDKAWDKNLPTDPNFVMLGKNPDFETEKMRLIGLISRFASQGPNAITKEPHPFFGKLTPQEWDQLQWNHLNHHLTQFGV